MRRGNMAFERRFVGIGFDHVKAAGVVSVTEHLKLPVSRFLPNFDRVQGETIGKRVCRADSSPET